MYNLLLHVLVCLLCHICYFYIDKKTTFGPKTGVSCHNHINQPKVFLPCSSNHTYGLHAMLNKQPLLFDVFNVILKLMYSKYTRLRMMLNNSYNLYNHFLYVSLCLLCHHCYCYIDKKMSFGPNTGSLRHNHNHTNTNQYKVFLLRSPNLTHDVHGLHIMYIYVCVITCNFTSIVNECITNCTIQSCYGICVSTDQQIDLIQYNMMYNIVITFLYEIGRMPIYIRVIYCKLTCTFIVFTKCTIQSRYGICIQDIMVIAPRYLTCKLFDKKMSSNYSPMFQLTAQSPRVFMVLTCIMNIDYVL